MLGMRAVIPGMLTRGVSAFPHALEGRRPRNPYPHRRESRVRKAEVVGVPGRTENPYFALLVAALRHFPHRPRANATI
jgi:hypothetical protein